MPPTHGIPTRATMMHRWAHAGKPSLAAVGSSGPPVHQPACLSHTLFPSSLSSEAGWESWQPLWLQARRVLVSSGCPGSPTQVFPTPLPSRWVGGKRCWGNSPLSLEMLCFGREGVLLQLPAWKELTSIWLPSRQVGGRRYFPFTPMKLDSKFA